MLYSLEEMRFGLALVQVGRLPVWREPDHADAVRQVAEAGRGHWRLGGHHHRHCHLLQVSSSPLHCNENPIYLFPEKELPVLSPNPHSCVCERFIQYIPKPYSSGQLTWGHPQNQCWRIRKYFFPIRIHGSVIPNSGSGSIFVANGNTIWCQTDRSYQKLLNIKTFFLNFFKLLIKSKDADPGSQIITDPQPCLDPVI
jgi:hypothetical protein